MQKLKNLAYILLLFALVIPFQNCVELESKRPGLKAAKAGGGDGYTGKSIAYVNVDISGDVCPAGEVRSKIHIDENKKALIVRENCQDITPKEVPLSQVGLRAYNETNLVYNNQVYDKVDAQTQKPPFTTHALCRKEAEASSPEAADLILLYSEDPQWFYGGIRMGTYSPSGEFELSLYSEELQVTKVSPGPNNPDQLAYYGASHDPAGAITAEIGLSWLQELGDYKIGILMYSLPFTDASGQKSQYTGSMNPTHCYFQ